MPDEKHQELVFLRDILLAIVSHKEDIVIERKLDDLGILLDIKVHPEDTGKIIGKGGKTIQALRTLLRAFGSQMSGGMRVNLRLQQ